MARRLLDVVLAALAVVATAPLLAVAAVGIRLSSPGPIVYRAQRVGRGRRLFVMYKLRTMHARPGGPGVGGGAGRDGSRITGKDDPRVFPFGSWLRRTKLDELPQLINVLKGDMSIVGPRPEDPRIVAEHYTPVQLETLTVRPGLASPGSIYSYTHGEALLAGSNPEAGYVQRLLPLKLALDIVYLRRASVGYDARLMARTAGIVLAMLAGRRRFADPPELAAALRLVDHAGPSSPSPARGSRLDSGGRSAAARAVATAPAVVSKLPQRPLGSRGPTP